MNPIEIRFKLNSKVSDITPEIHAEKQGCVHYQYSYKGKIIAETIIDDRNTFIKTDYRFSLIDGMIVIFVE